MTFVFEIDDVGQPSRFFSASQGEGLLTLERECNKKGGALRQFLKLVGFYFCLDDCASS